MDTQKLDRAVFPGAPENIAQMPDATDMPTPINFRTAWEIEQERLQSKVSKARSQPIPEGGEK